MRHVHRSIRVCRLHILTLALLAGTTLTTSAPAQVALGAGYTWQRASAGARHESLRGPSVELVGRVARRVGLLFAVDQFGYGSSRAREGFSLTSLRAGVRVLLVREEAIDLGVGGGLGLHSLDVGREEDGPGSTVFADVHLALHPVRYLGVFLGATVRSLSGFQGIGGHSTGLTLGIQLRGPSW